MSEVKELVKISNEIGKFKDLVQAGGGNTSVKTSDGKMIIKASGFTFSEMTENSGLVTLDYRRIVKFFENYSGVSNMEENERMYNNSLLGSMVDSTSPKPSMETGMHVFLDRVVVHTHPVMVNILACMKGGENIVRELFSDTTPEFLWLGYKTPGYNLAIEIKNNVRKYEDKNGVKPKIIFLKNHGLIVSGNDALNCMDMTFSVNRKIQDHIQKQLGIKGFPELKLINKSGFLFSENVLLKEIVNNLDDRKTFLSNFLIPDDAVYCSKFVLKENSNEMEPGKINFVKGEGAFYPWNEKKSKNIDEVLAGKLYALSIIEKLGEVEFLKDDDVNYLLSMESEKYRQKLNEATN